MSRVIRGPDKGSVWSWGATVVLAAFTCGCGAESDAGDPQADSAGFVRLGEPASVDESALRHDPPAETAERAPDVDPEVEPLKPQAPEVVEPPPGSSPQADARTADGVGPLETRASAALDAGSFAEAARAYSDLLLAEIRKDVGLDRAAMKRWSDGVERAQAGHRWNRRGAWPSVEVTVEPGDSLIAIRARALAANPGMLLCTGLIARANGLPNENAIRPGDVLRIPTDRAHMLVDISAMWALYLLGDEVAAAWEVGVGKDETPTRPGEYTIGLKQKDPMWSPVGRAPVPFGDPQNPLGTRWMAWYEGGKNSSLGFHGTNDERGIGGRVSDGCVRMRNRDVESLFEILPKDARARVQP